MEVRNNLMKVHIPNKENKILDDVLTQLYLMRTAVGQESTPKLLQRINKIRKELLKLKESNI
jgi:hypothetical protein